MIESILVPEERAKVINAKVIARVWDTKGVKVSVEGNSIQFEGEGLELLAAKNFIKAIGRGFSPIRAQRLLEDEEAQLEIVELNFGESRLRTVRSRLIGGGGKTRALLEESTGVVVSISASGAKVGEIFILVGSALGEDFGSRSLNPVEDCDVFLGKLGHSSG